ncbi:MAG TPA: chlorite dismutase family protein [Gemmatimonadales bacterium]|nr:chlorite dismutase family protein [Gemmatimonadales bacterium]
MGSASKEHRQVVRYAFYKLDPAWRRLAPERQETAKREFGETIESFQGQLLLRPYGLVGIRGDTDFLLWQVAEDLDSLVALQTALNRTDLGGYLAIPYSYLAMTRRSIYEFPEDPNAESRLVIRPSDSRYLFVYPFVKTRAWYALTRAERQRMMDEHVRIGRRYPSIKLNTTYSYGLDDQEFVVAFEGDSPAEFLDLVMELRESEASGYTLRDTPTFTCVQMSLWDLLDTLGGAGAARSEARRPVRADGFVAVASLAELPAGTAKRVYAAGEAVALFNVDGTVYAISNRCTHARASLSEGTVDATACAVTCPWHEGRFSLETGAVLGGPPVQAVRTYRVKIEGDTILIAPPAPAEAREPTIAR